MVKLTIDGKEVLVSENTTVLEAAQQAGIYIPKLCFHSKLSRYGACRVCLVKIEGVPKLSAACAVIAAEGMIVTTDTPEINKLRKTVVELMLLYHPLDCLVCDKGGECELQTLTFKLGVTEDRFKMHFQKYERIDVNHLISRDMKKCILCGKCVRVCDEIRGRGAIGYTYRGFNTRVDFPFGRVSNCEVCGQCLSVCPVGALAPRFSEYEARPWEMKQVKSVCPYCGCGCTVILDTKENKIVRITSKEGLGVNDGKICAKGRFGYDFVNNKFRLKYPLAKKDGMFVPVTWDEALDLIANKFKEITEKYGSDKIGGIGSNRGTNEESYLFQKFMRAVLKTNNIDSQIRIEQAASFKALTDSLGYGAATNSIPEIANTKVILLIGTDTTETLPIVGLEIKKAVREKKAKLIVINSREIDLTKFSDIWFQLKPGMELLLLSAMLKVVIDEKLYNESFIEKRTEDFDKVKTKLEKLSLDNVQAVTGISGEKIREAARLYAGAESAMAIYGLEFVLQEKAVDNVHALVNLVLACGHIGKENNGLIPLRQTNNGQGTTDMGVLPDYLSGYQSVYSASVKNDFEKKWKTKLPVNAGLTATEMIQSIPGGKIRGMYIVGSNPAVSHPNSKQAEANLKALDFLVVQDIFLSETAKLADVVLPAVSFAEKEGTFTNTERRIQKINKAIKPSPETKPDWKIFVNLAFKFGYIMEYLSTEEIFQEITSLVPIYRGITYEKLNEKEPVFWPCLSLEGQGTKVLYTDSFERVKAMFYPVDYKYSVPQPTLHFPYRIITNGTLFHHRSGVTTRRSKGMIFVEEEPKLSVHPNDAKKLEIEDDSIVKVVSKQGELETKVFITNKVMEGMLFLPLHANWNSNFNILTKATLDPLSKSPNMEETFVDVIPVTRKKEMVTLSINDKEITVEQGTTILEAAKKLDIYIPTLCYHSEMSPFGACRLCLVEIEGTNKLLASCITPVLNNMKVKTETESVHKLRKMILELLLAKHPVDCLVCDKGGECDLQKLSFLYGPDRNRFGAQPQENVMDDTRTLVERDMSKCILCKKCVRACSEMQGVNAIAFSRRGFKTEMGTFFGRGLDCEFCGRCVSVCPTGALANKLSKHAARPWELKEVSTICSYCGCGCSMTLNVKDNKIVKVTAKEGQGINNGNLCVKGRYGYTYVNDPERLVTPLIKRSGKFMRAPWEEAIKFIAGKLKTIKEQAGPDAIMGLGSAYCTNEDNYVFQKFMRTAIGTNNVDTTCFYYEHAASLKILTQMFGSGVMTNSFNEIAKAKSIIVIGTDITETHPTFALEVKRAVRENNANLIVIDPRRIKLTQISKLWLRPNYGTDVALINGIINIIISQGLMDQNFIENRTEGFEELQDTIREYTPELVSKITGVSKEDIVRAAELFTSSRNGAVLYGMGITQHMSGLQNVAALANLILLTGNVGRQNVGFYPLRGQCNSQGSCDMGSIPDFLPGYQKMSDLAMIRKFEKAWKVSLPMWPGLSLTEAVPAMNIGKVKALYIMAGNLKMSYPNAHQIEESMKKLEFLVVQDMFITETGKMADVILPACSFAEIDGTFTNMERRVQLLRKALPPVGESRPNWRIISNLSKAMGYDMNYSNVSEIMDEINQLVPIYGGITHKRLAARGLQWPCPDKNHSGLKYLYKMGFPNGKAKFISERYIPMAEKPDNDYPFLLTTGKLLFHYHTGVMTHRSQGIMDVCPEGFMEMNPKDAQKLNLKDKEKVRVKSRRGEISVKIILSDKTVEGVVFLPMHFKEIPVNIITNAALDPYSHVPEFKSCAVRIEKI
ncbi:MAG: formate dehydrogenase subunit alpha [bacterium]